MEETYESKVSNSIVEDVLGVPRLERDKYENNNVAGVAG